MNAPWWKRTTVYQIYPRSFADSNGDGIGDLAGVLGKLDYLQELGVETLWLSPFFGSPQADFGYDISDHYAVAPEYGTLRDVERLVEEVHARGMKIVFDMVLNHTSDRHPWFLASRSSRESRERDWYIWRDGQKPGGRTPPNNWRSMLGGSGWHWDEPTGQWYWASFLGMQPDLNYRNPEVKEAMLGVVRHWLERGVDGLRLDIFNAIFKDASYADNPWSWRAVPTEDSPHGFFQRHVHTIDHPDTIAFARELRAVVDAIPGSPRFLVGEVFGDAQAVRRYCGDAGSATGLHLVFLFQTLSTRFSARSVRALVEGIEHAFAEPLQPTYVFGNHDRPRFLHRMGGDRDKAKLMATLQLTVRGVPFVYYGEEIGMENHDIPLHEGLDPVAARFSFVPQRLAWFLRRHGILMNRDECRTPMQWDGSPSAGFTTGEPWLPVHPRSADANVAAQERDPASLLSCYRALLALRREVPALQGGDLQWIDGPREVVSFRRTLGDSTADVHLSFASRPVTLTLADPTSRAPRAIFSNRRGERTSASASYTLAPREGIVVFGG